MGHLTHVDTANSEIEAYLNKVLKNTNQNSKNEQQHSNLNGSAADNIENKTPPQKREPSGRAPGSRKKVKSTHDMLAEIFKKIGAKEHTREVRTDTT